MQTSDAPSAAATADPGMDAESPKRRNGAVWLAAAVLIAAGVATYWNSLGGVFAYDDHLAIRKNDHIRHLWPLTEAMSVGLWNTGVTVDGRPILSLSFAINHALLGGRPWSYHVGNILIHVAAALLLFGVIRRTLQRGRLGAYYGGASVWLALAAALLWMVHPLQTESVTYIVQRAESQMGMLFLLTLYCAIRGFDARGRSWPWYAAAALACWLGQATKEVIAVAPVIVFVYDWLFVSGSVKVLLRRRWGLYLALAGTWVVAGALLAAIPMAVTQDLRDLGMWNYALAQPAAILHYLYLTFWPSRLVLAYEWLAADHVRDNPVGAVVVAALVGLTVWALVRRKGLAFLGVWFFAALAPSSSFIMLRQTVHEHRMYLALASVAVLVVLAVDYVLRRLVSRGRLGAVPARVVAIVLLVAAGGTLACRTIQRNRDYHSELALWSANVQDRDASGMGHANLGGILMGQKAWAKALPHFEKAVALFEAEPVVTMPPGWIYNNIGICHFRLGQAGEALRHLKKAETETWEQKAIVYDMLCLANLQVRNLAEAERYGRMALALGTDPAEAHSNLAMVYERKGDSPKAIEHLRKAVSIKPNKGALHYNLGRALKRDGRMDAAIRALRKAVSLEPNRPMFRRLLGMALLQDGCFPEAIACLRQVLALQEDRAGAHADLAYALNKAGKATEAVQEYERALALDGGNFVAVTNLAWLLATSERAQIRNGRRAVELARLGCALRRIPVTLSILAAAQAEVGDFAQAITAQQEALNLLDPTQTSHAREYRRRLELYKRRRAYRQPSGE